jgi:hypothetical protein
VTILVKGPLLRDYFIKKTDFSPKKEQRVVLGSPYRFNLVAWDELAGKSLIAAKVIWFSSKNLKEKSPDVRSGGLLDTKNWSGRWDSNPRQLAWEASTLPLRHARWIFNSR